MGGENARLKVGEVWNTTALMAVFISREIDLVRRDEVVRVGSEKGVLGKRVGVAMTVGNSECQGLQPGGA